MISPFVDCDIRVLPTRSTAGSDNFAAKEDMPPHPKSPFRSVYDRGSFVCMSICSKSFPAGYLGERGSVRTDEGPGGISFDYGAPAGDGLKIKPL